MSDSGYISPLDRSAAGGTAAESKRGIDDCGNDGAFLPALAHAGEFPRPKLPVLPFVNLRDLFSPKRSPLPRRLQGRTITLTQSGRNALALIAASCANRTVLLPAYHCPSMIEPFLAAGAKVALYGIDRLLRPDADSLLRFLTDDIAAVLFTHYFGFVQDLAWCQDTLRARGITIIHDCAHAWYAVPEMPAADYAIASLPKFFAVEEGGLLVQPGESRGHLELRRVGFRRNLSLALQSLDRSRLSYLRRALTRLCRRETGRGGKRTGSSEPANVFRYYVPEQRDEAPAVITSILLPLVATAAAADLRRSNYRYMASRLAAVRSVEVLFPQLAEHTVPYVVPVLLRGRDAQFRAIRGAGIPLYRWEELAPSDCSISAKYRESLIQLPCHQDLSRGDLDVICDAMEHTGKAFDS